MPSILLSILIIASISAIADLKSAKCSRSGTSITCLNANRGVMKRLSIYYRNDTSLIVRESSLGILETGIFENLTLLERISLSTSGVRILQDEAFRGLDRLTHLNVAGNSIRNVSIGVFLGLDNLRFLDLSRNAITSLDLSLPELKYLDASSNRLEDIHLDGNFSQLETINIENNLLTEIPIDSILHYPKIGAVFFGGNSFNESYERFLLFALVSSRIKVDIDNTDFDDGWKSGENVNHVAGRASNESEQRSSIFDIENDFRLSPEVVKSLNHSQLADLVDRILMLRNFTLMERRMIEIDRKRILDESTNVKKEYTRIDQILKRYYEVYGKAKEESVGEYIEKSCQEMPNDTWWRRFKKWKCKKLFNWVKRLISR